MEPVDQEAQEAEEEGAQPWQTQRRGVWRWHSFGCVSSRAREVRYLILACQQTGSGVDSPLSTGQSVCLCAVAVRSLARQRMHAKRKISRPIASLVKLYHPVKF